METVEKLLNWIDSTGLSDLEFAQRAGVDNSIISKWRRTKTGNPRTNTVEKIKNFVDEFKIDNPGYNMAMEDTLSWTAEVVKTSMARIENLLQKVAEEQKKIIEIYEKPTTDRN